MIWKCWSFLGLGGPRRPVNAKNVSRLREAAQVLVHDLSIGLGLSEFVFFFTKRVWELELGSAPLWAYWGAGHLNKIPLRRILWGAVSGAGKFPAPWAKMVPSSFQFLYAIAVFLF